MSGFTWATKRFDWKSKLMRSQDIGRGAKQLGVIICDTYANRKTGKCWPDNATLALALNASERSVQRYLAQLFDFGWLIVVAIPRRRRGLQLCFPCGLEHDDKHDTEHSWDTTKPSCKHDKTVVRPIKKKEPSRNQGKSAASKRALNYIPVSANETMVLAAWEQWMEANMEAHSTEVFAALMRYGQYVLPSRFPIDDGSKDETYKRFFEAFGFG